MLQNQNHKQNQEQIKKIKIIIIIIVISIFVFIAFPPLIFILGFIYFKSGISFQKLLKYLGLDLKNNTNYGKYNHKKKSNSKIIYDKPVTYQKTSYDKLVESKKKEKLKKQKNNNDFISKKDTNISKTNYLKNNKKYEFNGGKSIWDDYESVLDQMSKK